MKERTLDNEIGAIRDLLIDTVADVLARPNAISRMMVRTDRFDQTGQAIPHCWLYRSKHGPVVIPMDDLTQQELDELMLATDIGDRLPCYFFCTQPNVLSYAVDRQTLH